MKVIKVRNVHDALWLGMDHITQEGVARPSRNGPVLQFPEPVTTVYTHPVERVVYWPERDCNPYFHFFESLWMLAGRRDVSFLTQILPRMAEFSDDEVNFWGAYGYRWRHWFGHDQLPSIWEALRANKDDRRQVLSMWDGSADLRHQGGKKDLPCNLQVIFQVAVDGRLDMTVTNRSNDMIWGAYGANAVHFSYLHEFMAAAVGVPVGIYRQVSNNLHVYTENPVYTKTLGILKAYNNPYHFPSPGTTVVEHRALHLAEGPYRFLDDCAEFCDNPDKPLPGLNVWLRRVAIPMWKSFRAYSEKDNRSRYFNAKAHIESCEDQAWRVAVTQWIQRRQVKKAQP